MKTAKEAGRRAIAQVARAAAPKAIAKLEALIDDPDPRVAIEASKHILDRAIGKPVAMTADVTDRLDEFTDEQLDAAIADLENRIGLAAKGEGEKATTPVTH